MGESSVYTHKTHIYANEGTGACHRHMGLFITATAGARYTIPFHLSSQNNPHFISIWEALGRFIQNRKSVCKLSGPEGFNSSSFSTPATERPEFMLPSLLPLCKPRQLVVQLKVWFNPSHIRSDKRLGGLPVLRWQHHANYRAEPSLSLTSFPQKIASSFPGRLGAWLLSKDDSMEATEQRRLNGSRP